MFSQVEPKVQSELPWPGYNQCRLVWSELTKHGLHLGQITLVSLRSLVWMYPDNIRQPWHSYLSESCVRRAFCSAALLSPAGSELGQTGLPLGRQREGPTLSTPPSPGVMASALPPAGALGGGGGGGGGCSGGRLMLPRPRILALVGGDKRCTRYRKNLHTYALCHDLT